jgi:RNA polymerase sigma-70 factor (ECF subfamily)
MSGLVFLICIYECKDVLAGKKYREVIITVTIDEDFYLRHHKLIAGIASRILFGAIQDIEDCTNEIYIALMAKIGEFDPQRGTIEAYVSVVSRSAALNFAKKLRNNRDIATGEQIEIIDVSDEYGAFADFEAIKESLDALTKDEKVLFTLKYVYYHTAAQIAKYCKISVAAAEKRTARLRAKLQKLLKEKGFDY